MLNNKEMSSVRERMAERRKEKEAEAAFAKEITTNGKRLGLSWYKYDNEYYQVIGSHIAYAKQKRLRLDIVNSWYIVDLANMNACVLYLDGFERVLNGVALEDIIIYPDKYFVFKNLNITELWYKDKKILVADQIYRLDQNIWEVVSNNVYYITNLDPRSTTPVSNFPLEYYPETKTLVSVKPDGSRTDLSKFLRRLEEKQY